MIKTVPPLGGISDEHGPIKRKLILSMCGSSTYLPDKLFFFTNMSTLLNADLISFSYRGFGDSDGYEPTEEGIMTDCRAIFAYFKQYAEEMKGKYD